MKAVMGLGEGTRLQQQIHTQVQPKLQEARVACSFTPQAALIQKWPCPIVLILIRVPIKKMSLSESRFLGYRNRRSPTQVILSTIQSR